MKIGPVDSGDRSPKPEGQGGRRHNIQPDSRRKSDSVDISESGRSLAEQPASQEIEDTAHADPIERARQRAESDYYDRPDVRNEIARRIADDFTG